jgi:hypothetical protein
VPVAYVVEWFARAAAAHAPHLRLEKLFEVKVFSGIVVQHFDSDKSMSLSVAVTTTETTDSTTTLRLDLSDDETGRPRYRCSATLTSKTSAHEIRSAGLPDSDEETAWTDTIYDEDVLFHGPKFQVIEQISKLTTAGLEATVDGLLDKDWPSEPWVTDPALVDAGLQMALLWTKHLLGGPSLPTAIGEIRIVSPPVPGPLSATLTMRDAGSTRVICDVAFHDSDDEPVAELIAVETHLLQRK